MAPRKAGKASGESSSQNTDVLSDTSPRRIDSIRTWTQVFNIWQHELVNCLDDLDDEETESLATKYKIVSQSELHKIAMRPRILPYNDMIDWALENVDLSTKTIFNSQKVVVGSFRPEHLHVIYQLSLAPNFIYNANFLMDFDKKECTQYGKNLPDLIKEWCSRPEKFRVDSHGIYVVSSLEPHMMYIEMMMCRLYGRENTTHFLLLWVPIMQTAADVYSFDWAKILSNNLVREITEYQSLKAKGQPAPFFMSAYIMDVICFMTPFPLMGWNWTPNNAKPIHVYHSKLWEDKVKDFFYEICNWVVVPMHISIYGFPTPRISDKIVTNLGKIAYWYIEEHFSYIRVFGCLVPPHAPPKFLPDRLVCCKVAHQTVHGGISKELKGVHKRVWPAFPMKIGMFSLLYFLHSKVEATTLEEIKLVNIEFKNHDPQKIVGNHMALYNLKRYEHEYSPHNEIFQGARSYKEVLSRVQTLAPDKLAEFYNFQKHQRNRLPKAL
jgi:hypothetical protein